MWVVFSLWPLGSRELEFWFQADPQALPMTVSLQHTLLSRDKIWGEFARMKKKEKLCEIKWNIYSSALVTFPLLCACPLTQIPIYSQMINTHSNIGVREPGQNAQISWAHQNASIFFPPKGSFRELQRFVLCISSVRGRSLTKGDPVDEWVTWVSDSHSLCTVPGLAPNLFADAWNSLPGDKPSHSAI